MAELVTVVIAIPLDAELVEPIRTADPRVQVAYAPDLLPPLRYPNDHAGVDDFRRAPEDERRWWEMIAGAEVLYGLPGDSPEGLALAIRHSPGLRWVQATSAGAGEQVGAAGLSREELERVTVTSAAGVHAGPLAEWALLGLLAFAKDLPRLLDDQHAHRWGHYPVGELSGRTLLVVGLGQIGEEVARLAAAFGMRVIGVNRSGKTDSPHVHEIRRTAGLHACLPEADAVVIAAPLTEETRGLIDAAAIARMRPGTILVNIGRGGVVDEAALIEALRSGRLAGAALEVFAREPLPPHSPLWDLPNVLVSPHTAGLSTREDERIVSLFVENLGRYLRGEPLRNRVDPELLY
ncbi:MAG TPA: D-2-hydroxyacid dehydrogenase [Solirubrobacteraceae bacterium]|nr:D-2-hydroxyacid dehydrogenase [Solirubrobacteraceae bacterium]